IEDSSRSQIQTWIKDQRFTVHRKSVKVNYKFKRPDVRQSTLPAQERVDIIPEHIPLTIVYEDDDLLIVNKPKGMVVHPSPGHKTKTLVHALLYHCQELSTIGGRKRPGIVHRLDKDTSGLLMVAKNDTVHLQLSKQLTEKTIERIYEAIVHGVLPHDQGKIDAPIARNPKKRQEM